MIARCEFYHASLLASAATVACGLGEAARAVRRAQPSALQAERQWSIGLARKSGIVTGVTRFAAMFVFLVAGMLFSLGDTPDGRTNALVAWTLCGLVGLGIAGRWLWKTSHLRRATRTAQGLIERFGGRAVTGARPLVEWLELFWWDDFPVYRVSSAADNPAVACAVRGFPALVLINPLDKTGWIEVLLSVWYPGSSEFGTRPEKKKAFPGRSQLLAQGFQIHAGPSGLRASITRVRTRAVYPMIDLGEALISMAELARAQGGQPQEPLSI